MLHLYFFFFCVTACSYANNRAESVGYCVGISIVCMCVVHGQAQFELFTQVGQLVP